MRSSGEHAVFTWTNRCGQSEIPVLAASGEPFTRTACRGHVRFGSRPCGNVKSALSACSRAFEIATAALCATVGLTDLIEVVLKVALRMRLAARLPPFILPGDGAVFAPGHPSIRSLTLYGCTVPASTGRSPQCQHVDRDPGHRRISSRRSLARCCSVARRPSARPSPHRRRRHRLFRHPRPRRHRLATLR